MLRVFMSPSSRNPGGGFGSKTQECTNRRTGLTARAELHTCPSSTSVTIPAAASK